MNKNDINDFLPSLLFPRCFKKDRTDLSLTQNSVVSRCSLSLRKSNGLTNLKNINKVSFKDKENCVNLSNLNESSPNVVEPPVTHTYKDITNIDTDESMGFSALDDINTVHTNSEFSHLNDSIEEPEIHRKEADKVECDLNCSYVSLSSATDLVDCSSEKTVIYDSYKPTISLNLGFNKCNEIDISTNKDSLKRVFMSTVDDQTIVDCEVVESSQISSESTCNENMEINLPSLSNKRNQLPVSVNIEIKRKKFSDSQEENSKILILKTNAIEKLSHVIVQPPNYNIVKRQILDRNKIESGVLKGKSPRSIKNGNIYSTLKQKSIDEYFCGKSAYNSIKVSNVRTVRATNGGVLDRNAEQDMSKNLGVADAVKYDRCGRGSSKSKKGNESPRTPKPASRRSCDSPRLQDAKMSNSEAPRSPRTRNDSLCSHSPRKNAESIQLSLPPKSKSTKASSIMKTIPHHKIVAGTDFAVDAFSYGDIPNVKHYFLTHFHSDHYSGLKKTFNKLLFCTKITADLCTSRLGVNPKCIHVINPDEFLRIDGVEVTAVDANHCPGAIMLIFTLPNGKTLLHTGDFRASPIMESYPIFWNRDIHTVYLDTTYCNPRYDFPTQDQSLEMALFILKQKKLTLENEGKKFSSVLIVCGTYTIGKEKFFLGMARRVGCSVWACPEKDRVLQAVEGRSFSHALPQSCQLHVVPMRDLTHEKLRSYLDNLQGAFNEIVAFKPSGWENGKNSAVEKNMVTIHGIPYSEHSSFSEMIRFVKFLKPKQVVPTVGISGGTKAVQKYFPCPLLYKEDIQCQSKVTDYFSIQSRQQVPAVT